MPVTTGGRGLRATLDPARLSVEPGGSASAELRVEGVGVGADALGFEVLGEAAQWSWVVPPGGPVGSGEEVVARFVTRPPKASSPAAGESTLCIRVWVKGDATAEAQAEAILTIAAFADLHASLSPAVAEGRSVGDYELTVENRGNAVASVAVGTEGDTTLTLRMGSQNFLATPGLTTRAKVRVRSRRRLLRGQPIVHRFRLSLRSGAARPVEVAGELHQTPLLAGRLPVVALAVAALADGCTPVRSDPCQPVHYVVNSSLAPPTGLADVREAFSRLAVATGITFVDDGTTDEANRAGTVRSGPLSGPVGADPRRVDPPGRRGRQHRSRRIRLSRPGAGRVRLGDAAPQRRRHRQPGQEHTGARRLRIGRWPGRRRHRSRRRHLGPGHPPRARPHHGPLPHPGPGPADVSRHRGADVTHHRLSQR